MKKRFLLLTLIMCLLGGVKSSLLNAQDDPNVVTIDGNGNNSSQYGAKGGPFEVYSTGITSSQSIYTSAEIGRGEGKIEKIAFKVDVADNSDYSNRSIIVWLKNTLETNFGKKINQALIQMTDADKVYTGSYNVNTSGWIEIDITDFDYNGTNLLVSVCDVTCAKGSSSTQFNMYWSKEVDAADNYWYKTLYKSGARPDGTTNFNGVNYTASLQLTFAGDKPTAPTLISPKDKATDQFNPTLSWAFGDNTEEYQVLLAKATEDFPEVDDEKWTKTQNATEGSYTTSGLERNTEYKWQVVTKNLNGVTPSDTHTFTTLDKPTAPILESPNGTTVDINNPTLKFTLSDNTTQYQIFLDKNENPITPVNNDWINGNGDVSYQTSKLDAGATYYWKVIAKNGEGEVASGTYQFTTANILRVTDYEIKLDGNNITLEWQYADQNANEYQVCFGKTEQEMESHNPDWESRETVDENLVEDDSVTIKDANSVDKVYYFRVKVRKDGGEAVVGTTVFCVILDEDKEWNDSYNNADYVFVRANVRVTENITAKNITIENGGILRTIMPSVDVVVSANTLVVNEGGQFFAANKLTYFPINTVKFNKKIANPEGEWNANNKTGWQFISSPFKDAPISSFIPGQGDYDLYKYGSAEKQWVNYKDSELAEPFAQDEIFAQGIGYLASYQTKDTLTLTGNNGSINRINILNIGQKGMMETPGIYLLGNPFLFNMDWNLISTNGAYGINATSFVVVKADGAYQYKTSGEIKVGEGFFVLTTGNAYFDYTFDAGDFAPSSKSRNAGQSKSLNIIATGNAGNDNVVVNFNGEGEGFPKLQNFNDDIATVYVQNNDANYGVYNCDENTTEVELCFNANQMGNYTISVEPTGEFSSIVLVDRFTGIETNLLVEDYHFTAMSEENNNRFIVKLAVSDQQSAVSDNFVYQSGEELIIEAEGTVQIIDVMGRVVYNSNVENNRINVSDFNNGTYVVRVINETGVKVEKVVIY